MVPFLFVSGNGWLSVLSVRVTGTASDIHSVLLALRGKKMYNYNDLVGSSSPHAIYGYCID